jgi:hypothetical protein
MSQSECGVLDVSTQIHDRDRPTAVKVTPGAKEFGPSIHPAGKTEQDSHDRHLDHHPPSGEPESRHRLALPGHFGDMG